MPTGADDIAGRTWALPVGDRATGPPVDVMDGASGLEQQVLSRVRRIDLGVFQVQGDPLDLGWLRGPLAVLGPSDLVPALDRAIQRAGRGPRSPHLHA